MKRLSKIFCLLLILNIFVLGCSKTLTSDNNILKLDILESSDERIIATDKDSDINYEIPNSNIEIKDANNKSLSWDELKKAKSIDVYYSGDLKEVSPVVFEKIDKIIITS